MADLTLLTVEELAAEIRLAESTFYTWRRRGQGPKSFKLGKRIVYRRSDVDASAPGAGSSYLARMLER